jgi:hypothetical protein
MKIFDTNRNSISHKFLTNCHLKLLQIIFNSYFSNTYKMGCDHAIVVGLGYRIPIKEWTAFKVKRVESLQVKRVESLQLRSKKIKLQDNFEEDEGFCDGDDDIDCDDIDWEIGQIEGHNERPKTHGFISQDNCTDSGYVFIYNLESAVYLMDRKIGGAMSWMCNGFEHMHNVSTLNFSIQLEYEFEDWKLESGEWHEDTQQRKDFVEGLPQLLKDFINTLPVNKYYNKWLFSYAC